MSRTKASEPVYLLVDERSILWFSRNWRERSLQYAHNIKQHEPDCVPTLNDWVLRDEGPATKAEFSVRSPISGVTHENTKLLKTYSSNIGLTLIDDLLAVNWTPLEGTRRGLLGTVRGPIVSEQ